MQVNRLISALSAMLLPLPAAGQSAVDVARKAHLMGTWAMSCEAPHVPSNSRIIYYTAPDGRLGRKIDRGPGYPALEGVVDYIEVNDDDSTIRLRFHVEGERPLEAVMLNLNSHLRILSATTPDGVAFIKDGLVTQNGKPAPLLEKCADAGGTS
jgi:hypothetical protein